MIRRAFIAIVAVFVPAAGARPSAGFCAVGAHASGVRITGLARTRVSVVGALPWFGRRAATRDAGAVHRAGIIVVAGHGRPSANALPACVLAGAWIAVVAGHVGEPVATAGGTGVGGFAGVDRAWVPIVAIARRASAATGLTAVVDRTAVAVVAARPVLRPRHAAVRPIAIFAGARVLVVAIHRWPWLAAARFTKARFATPVVITRADLPVGSFRRRPAFDLALSPVENALEARARIVFHHAVAALVEGPEIRTPPGRHVDDLPFGRGRAGQEQQRYAERELGDDG